MQDCNPSYLPTILSLLATPDDQRDAAWVAQFYAHIVDCSMTDDIPQVFFGPDHFPYFGLKTPPADQSYQEFCIRSVLEKLTEDGVGVAINREGLNAEWVFSYGDLLTLRMFGAFEVSGSENVWGVASGPQGNQVLVSQPSETFLPGYARKVIRQYMQKMMGIAEPRVFLLSRPGITPPQELVFSVFREDFATPEIFQGAMGALRWFLPRHYGMVSVPKDSQWEQYFQPL
ncbi:MAG TPA: hypothetical protein PK530_12915 [Anaerolineales bacterium]|nr:hypothetical protein [Anaerolineales bacterium]